MLAVVCGVVMLFRFRVKYVDRLLLFPDFSEIVNYSEKRSDTLHMF